MRLLKPNIRFFYPERRVSLSERARLKRFLGKLFQKEEQVLGELSFVFCSDEHLLSINKEFLRHNYYTDILTFDLSDRDGPIRGEIYISVDRVRENARTHGSTIKNELHRVIFHGVLHLCGFRDKKTRERQIMRKMEDKYLELYFQ